MKTTCKNFEAQTLSHEEMRAVDGGWWQAALAVVGTTVLVGILIKDYYDAKREAQTGEYQCGCNN